MQDPELVNSIKQWILQPTLEYIDRTRTVDAIVHSHAAVVSPTSFQTARSLVGLPRYVRVTNYAPRFDTSRFPYIDHLPVLQQTFGCLCGFHALHNMCCFVHALFAPDLKRKVKHLLKLRNSFSYVSPANVSSFWRFYGKIRDNLIEYLKSNEEEYNIESYMHDGSLDSDHLSYLLQFYPKLIKVFSSYPGYRIEHCQLFFSYDHFTFGTPKKLCEVQERLDDFTNSRQPGAFIIFLGVIKHWTLLVIHQDGEGKRNFYFLDSNNIPFLHVGPEGSYAAALDYFTEYWRIVGKKQKLPKVKLLSDVHVDMQTILSLIYNNVVTRTAALKEYDLTAETRLFMEEYTPLLQSLSEILDLTIPAALVAPSKECFEHLQKLALAAEASKRTALVGELYVWLQDHVAKMIKDGIFKEIRTVGKVHMRTDRLGLMRSWCELQRTVLKGKKQYLAEQKGTKCTCKYSGYGPEVLLPEFAHLIGKFRRLLE